jgi:2,3-bisphosphoglycerate-independent phosphoglycerate mutase
VEVVDECLGKLIPAARAAGFVTIITADHGNADEMADKAGNPLTSHTTNPVPFILVGADAPAGLRPGGKLADIAPTILEIMGFPAPPEMDGVSLLRQEPARPG